MGPRRSHGASLVDCGLQNLNGMNLKMLQGRDEESRRMIEWVEKGIYDAVDNSYLKRLYFGVSADQEGADLVEEYIFSFSYGENGTSRCYVHVVGGAKG